MYVNIYRRQYDKRDLNLRMSTLNLAMWMHKRLLL